METERDRMKSLLVEAIATLCRNGLKYNEELSVEGLIGITIDRKDVFLVSVKETFSTAPKETEDMPKQGAESDTETSHKVERRSAKRHGDHASGKGPPEKHKRKGAPKQITGDEIELINNSPVPQDDSNDESMDHNSLSSIGDSSNLTPSKTTDPIVIEDADLLIKKEKVKHDNSVCIYEAGERQASEDPRSKHPAGVDQEQMGLILAEEVKHIKPEHDSDADISVFNTPSGEVIRVPRSLTTASSSQGQDNLSDFSGVPVEWAGPSTSQDFAQLSSDDQSLLESSPHQAPGSAGASQQVDVKAIHDWVKNATKEGRDKDGKIVYMCPTCPASYRNRYHVMRHYKAIHLGQRFLCYLCHKPFKHQRWSCPNLWIVVRRCLLAQNVGRNTQSAVMPCSMS